MYISFTRVKITPPVGIRLGGFAHRMASPSVQLHDDLYARLLKLSDPRGNAVILVQLDLLGVYYSDVEKIRRIISGSTGVEEDHVLVAATHTHSSPETIIPMWPHTFPYSDEEKRLYDKWFSSLLASLKSGSEAINNVEFKASVGFNVVKLNDNVCVNRLTGSFEELELSILSLTIDGKLRVVVVDYPCHPACNIDLGISADYPGNIYDRLVKYGIEPVFITGFAGDVTPRIRGSECVERLSEFLSSNILNLLNHVSYIEPYLSLNKVNITLPARTVPNVNAARERFLNLLNEAKSRGLLERRPMYELWSGLNRLWLGGNVAGEQLLMDLLYADEEYSVAELNEESVRLEVGMFSIGGLNMLMVPGEPFLETLSKVRSSLRKASKLIGVGYANGYVGYIPTREAFKVGAYEARLARWSRVTEDAEELLISQIVSAFS